MYMKSLRLGGGAQVVGRSHSAPVTPDAPPPQRLRRAAAFVRPFRRPIAAILALSLGLAAINAVEPLVLKLLFDEIGGAAGHEVLARAVLYLLGLALFREATTAVTNWLTWRTRLKLHHDLLESAVTRLHGLPVSYHQAEGVGATMTRLDRGIQGFISAFNEVAFNALPAAVYLGIAMFFMFELDWRLALMVLVFTPVPAAIAAFAAPVQTRRERRLLDRWAAIYSRFNEVLSGIVTVKSFAREEIEKQRFLDEVADANADVARGVGFDARVGAAQNAAVAGARIAAIGFGGYLVLQGTTTLGTLIAFLSYVSGLFGPVQGLTHIYKTVRTASVSLDTIIAILDAPDGVRDAPNAREVTSLRGEVRFERVRFTYPNSRHELLAGIDLHAAPGERVAIVGPSGAGKSTLMALLQRFYDPTEGRVCVDGRDLRTLRQRSLRRQIGVVLQDALLFNDTVRNNIAYGRGHACNAEICEAARHANAHDMILRLPDGYETLVGERGSRLSVGERQRIAIARALLKDPPLLILDEATSALDAESEALVQDALDRLTRDRTTFIIAHRLSTVVSADRIVVLRDGRIHETGSHDALMRAGGYYASLVRRQVGGLLTAG